MQRITRILVEQVRVTVDKASERVDIEPQRVGGLVESHALARPVRRHDPRGDYPRLVARLRAWSAEGMSTEGTADRL